MSDHSAKHPFHMVNPSPWPAMGAFSALILAIGAILYFHKTPVFGMENLGVIKIIPGLFLVVLTMVLWWRDVIKESVVEHAHSP
jgi:cytochrome c oxidase subunit 3